MEPYDVEDFFPDRKAARKARKAASKRDRSKFKKTDRDQLAKRALPPPSPHLIRGRVLSLFSQGALVQAGDRLIPCILRGQLKKEKTHHKNLLAVGDFVLFEPISQEEGLIVHIEKRRSILARADTLSRREKHIIASNIDQVVITASIVSPPLKPHLIDRYIIAATQGNMAPIIVVNKIDLLKDASPKEKRLFEDFLAAFSLTPIPVIPLSATTGDGLDKLREAMHEKASVFSGQSGVGKSSLIQAITGKVLKIGSMVEKTQKGSHTTTAAQLIPLEGGGFCIDTPGIQSFGLWNLQTDQIESYFAEIHSHGKGCFFDDCTHRHEKQCAVMQAVEEGKIAALRYDSYCHLMDTVAKKHKRR